MRTSKSDLHVASAIRLPIARWRRRAAVEQKELPARHRALVAGDQARSGGELLHDMAEVDEPALAIAHAAEVHAARR
jgi:hypothetical protein